MAVNPNVKLVRSSRGAIQIELEGYRYSKVRHHKDLTKTYWRCQQREICRGSLITNFNIQAGVLVQGGQRHSHEPDFIDMEVQDVVRSIKRKAADNPNLPPSAIFLSEVSSVSNQEVLVNLPQRNDIIRNINRVQNRNRPVNPNSLADLNITPPYDRTLNGQLFFQHDGTIENENETERFLVFYTDGALEKLCNSRVILCDGTFKSVPRLFFQLYTIHGIVDGLTYPLIYCLSTKKTENFYRQLLEHLRTRSRNRLNPQIIMCDFELAFMNAARALFPDAQTKGCLFHFTQSIWRYLVSKGLKTHYLNREAGNLFRELVQKLLTLPFIPVTDIHVVFDDIITNMPEFDEIEEQVFDLINYIEVTYVRGRAARGRRAATNPRFGPEIWSVYDLVLNKFQRSNNSVEGWNSRFMRLSLQPHVGVWKFMENLQRDQHDNEISMLQRSAGHTRVRYHVKGVYKRNQEMIETIVSRYQTYKDENNIGTYLTAISHRIKLYTDVEAEAQAAEQAAEQ